MRICFGFFALALGLGCGPKAGTPQAGEDETGEDGTSTTAAAESTGDAAGDGTTATDPIDDISGTYLLAVAASISPTTPLQFIATVAYNPALQVMGIELQALSLDIGQVTTPREPVGAPAYLQDIPVGIGGGFTLDLVGFEIVGAANPITGSDIRGDLTLSGTIFTPNLWCGTASGAITAPANIDLTGSTFAAVRITATDPASLPTEVQAACR